MNNIQFGVLPRISRFCAGASLAAATAFLLASPAQATRVRLSLGEGGTYAQAYGDNDLLEVNESAKNMETTAATAGEVWYLSAETTTKPGYTFDHWKVTPAAANADVEAQASFDPFSPDATVTLGTAETYIFTALYKKIQHVLTVTSDGHESYLRPPLGDNYRDENSTVTLLASDPEGYSFYHWALTNAPAVAHPAVNKFVSGSTTNYSILMDDDYQVMAVYKKKLFVTYKEYDPTLAGSEMNEPVGEGTKPTISVPNDTVPVNNNERWACNGWKDGGPQIPPTGGATSYTFAQPVSTNNTLTWTWKKQFCVIGTIDGYGDIVGLNTAIGDNRNWFDENSEMTVSATPAAGYVFAGWLASPADALPTGSEGNRVLTVEITKPFTLIARFQVLSADSDGDGMTDEWEQHFGLDPFSTSTPSGGMDDPDNDGLSNLAEYVLYVQCTNNTGKILFSDPTNADSDGDGMDDGWEYQVFGGDVDFADAVPPGLDSGNFAPNGRYGANGNPDKDADGNDVGDYRFSTETGWQTRNMPLVNIMEYLGPDDQPPYLIVAVVPGQTSDDGWQNTLSKTVYRRVPNPDDTGDGSHPMIVDTDKDGLDDGFEYSWDQWHQANGGAPLANQTIFPDITETVEPWDPAANRPFNPAVAGGDANTDQDYLYSFVIVPEITDIPNLSTAFTDIEEATASTYFQRVADGGDPTHSYFIARTPPAEAICWCTNPLLWDTDGDGMSDGFEVSFGFDPWAADAAAQGNPDDDYYAVSGALRHREVYDSLGFNPYTGWGPANWKGVMLGGGADTEPYSNIQEFIGAALGDVPRTLANQADWQTTNPRTHDQDGDGMWDGWELYVGFSVEDVLKEEGNQHYDVGSKYFVQWIYAATGDNLSNYEEFLSNVTPPEGLDAAIEGFVVGGWRNKTYPTDPWDWDTDSDQVLDGDERDAFNAGTADDLAGAASSTATGLYVNGGARISIVENGGLCATTADTDGDHLPDAWELRYGTMEAAAAPAAPVADGEDGADTNVTATVTAEAAPAATCNGTIADAEDDPDNDGLANYQEYMLGAIAHWQFQNNDGRAIWEPGWDIAGYDPYFFFDPFAVNPLTGNASLGEFYQGYGGRAPRSWDPNSYVDPPKNTIQFYFMTGPDNSTSDVWYSTGDPLDYDTDQDGMDDYWETFHGLNPLFGTIDIVRSKTAGADVVAMSTCGWDQYDSNLGWAVTSDFRKYPWLAGNLYSDSDQDQLSDIDESLQPRYTTGNLPPNYHTDPSPLWMTDISSPDSFANLYFKSGVYFADPLAPQWFWAIDLPYPASTYLFDFEMNEGFDSDGDFVGDRAELAGSNEAPGVSDPLDAVTPVKRRALYLNGDAAARTGPQFGHKPYDLAQFTIDCWVRPENPASGQEQVILERSALVPQGSSMQPFDIPVVNFRLGIDAEGVPFVSYNGSQNPLLFVEAKAQTIGALSANKWYHLAATYGGEFRSDGQWTGKLRLYVDGRTVASTDSSEIPFSGWIIGFNDSGAQEILIGDAVGMVIVVGAADDRPDGRIDGHEILVGAGAGIMWDPPALKNYFQGWVDQVRIWNDPLTQAEIEQYKDSRFTRADVIAMAKDPLDGGHGLLYSYTFDNLPDPDYDPVFPKGFEMLNGRPTTWIQAPFWGLAPDRSEWYDDYRVIPWIENQVYHNPYDVPRDQASEDSPSLGNSDAFFANTANPYFIVYKCGQDYSEERHPFMDTWIEDTETLEDIRAISLKPDLLPLHWAAADEDVEMWDKLGTGREEYNLDSDGDGLPDAWEIANGLDHLDATGRNGAAGDIDGDGLSNYAEYIAGTDPWAADSDFDGIDDFNDRSDNPADDQRTFGERLTDNDFVEDLWESQFDDYYASHVAYDAHFDRDDDGWSNWSEARAHTDPDKAYKVGAAGDAGTNVGECPTPTINATINYHGANDKGSLIVYAYSSPSMDGRPDAIISGNARHVNDVGITIFVTEMGGQLVWIEDADGYNCEIPAGNGIVPGSIVIKDANGTVVHIDNGDGTFGSTVTKIDYASGRMNIQNGYTADYSYRTMLQWPMECTLTTYTYGWVREGRNYFWAFLDTDGDNEWSAGEPAGLADGYVHDVGYDSLKLNFTLTDDAPGFARLHFADAIDQASIEDHMVTIENAGNIVFRETLRGPRAFLHEGDFIYCEDNALIPADAQGNPGQLGGYGNDWGVRSKDPIYKWYVDGILMGVFTNHYPATLGAPEIVSPKGAIVQYARPEFRFHLDPTATMFQLQVRTADSHQVVYDATTLAPPRQREGLSTDICVWQFPYCVNQDLPNGTIFANGGYQWRVRGLSPHAYNGSAWSSGPASLEGWQEFSMNVQTDAEAAYRAAWLQVDVKYYGKALAAANVKGRLRVQAFETASFNDRPAAEVVVDEPGIVTIAGLKPGNYYVRAFVDQYKNYERENWETWGYVRDSGNTDWPFTPKAVVADDSNVKSVVPELVMQDCDTDQDGLPDSWEYRYNGAKADWLSVYGIQTRPVESGVSASISYTDSDGDGLSDFAEYLYGANPTSADSDGDGIADGSEVALGFASAEANALRITSLPGANLSWAWDGAVADTGIGAFSVRSGNAPTLAKSVTYVLERATSLIDQDWTEIARGTTAESIGTLAVPDEGLDSAFYRVRAIIR